MIKLACFSLLLATPFIAVPIDGLVSSDQATRDAAAKTIRASYVEPSKDKCGQLLAKLKPGMTKTQAIRILEPFSSNLIPRNSSGEQYSEGCRLDDIWMATLWFETSGKFVHADLIRLPRDVPVAPPPNFTGTWTTYFLNGEISRRIQYRDGVWFGEVMMHNGDGILFVQRYDESGCDGNDIGYYPSGKILWKGQWKAGQPVGVFQRFSEDGKVIFTQNHSE